MKQKLVILIFFLSCSFLLKGQTSDNILERLQGIKNSGYEFYNIDGYDITSLKMTGKFTTKSIARKYRKLGIRSVELINRDTILKKVTPIYIKKNKLLPI